MFCGVMYLPLWALAAVLGVVEGLTEFIPVSSTGHLILVDHLLEFHAAIGSADRAELFEVVIQLGAILAVGFLYRRDLIKALTSVSIKSEGGRLRSYLIAAFIPAAAIGFLLHKQIKTLLFNPMTVAIALIVGGIVIITIEKTVSTTRDRRSIKTMTMRDAVVVGLSQVLSLIPGVSRSGATIMGGYAGGLSREAATEFSFLLSFPIMLAASGYELIKYRDLLSSETLTTLAIGFITAFLSALVVVKWLIGYVRRHNFIGFGIYRIIFGVIILFLLHSL
jgi:undecaprenyl-diphosphatase